MNRLEAQQTIKQFGRIAPGFAEWRERCLNAASAANGTDKAEEWQAMLDSTARTLSAITEAEATSVLRRMEEGRLPVPPYGEIALTILREAKIARQSTNRFHDSQPKYHCLDCLDTGVTNVWNPEFVEAYRDQFAEVTRKEFDRAKAGKGIFNLDRYDPDGTVAAWEYDPPNWVYLASQWWKEQGGEGPLHHVALCNCDCPRQRVLSEELESFRSGERRGMDGKRAAAPGCGLAKYNPKTMPRKTPNSFDDLHAWYASHAVNEIYEWQPA